MQTVTQAYNPKGKDIIPKPIVTNSKSDGVNKIGGKYFGPYKDKKLPSLEQTKDLIPNYKVQVPQESINLVMDVLKSGWIGGDGPKVKEFEKRISEIIGNKNVLALNSGTSGLQLALRMAGVAGGEVISTPMTCFATNAAISQEGADIVWADIDPETGCINPYDIARRVTKKTKAIMIVHWGGYPCDLDLINKIGKLFGIPVIEDAAQAIGSEYKGKPIGSHSDYVVFSTQAIKIINTSDGGILATKKRSDYETAKRLRWYGIDRDKRIDGPTFWHYPIKETGSKMQMTDLSAALGLGQLGYLDGILKHRRKIAKIYNDAIDKSNNLKYQKVISGAKPNFWIYTVITQGHQHRLKLFYELRKIGVKAEEAHRRNDLYPVFEKYKKDDLPGVTRFDEGEIIIPVGQWVSEQKARDIAKVLMKF